MRTYSTLSLGFLALTACGIQLNEQSQQPLADAGPGGSSDGRTPTPDAAPDAMTPLPTGPFGPATKVMGLSGNLAEDDVTMRLDELEVFIAIVDNGDKDLYTAKRAAVTDPFPTPTKIATFDTADSDSAARLSADALTIYYGTRRGGNSEDVWKSTRATTDSPWGTPTVLPAVNSNTRTDRWYNPCGGRYVMISDRDNQGDYDLYEGVEGQAPTRLPISTNGSSDLSPYLTSDCLTMYWSHDGDIYMASRTTPTGAWTANGKATDLSKDGSNEQDPWMSADRKRMYFASDVDGEYDIYMATRDK